MGGECAPSHAVHTAETYCLILFFIVRFTNKGNAIMSAIGTATRKSSGGGGLFLGGGNSRATPSLYEALVAVPLNQYF